MPPSEATEAALLLYRGNLAHRTRQLDTALGTLRDIADATAHRSDALSVSINTCAQDAIMAVAKRHN